MERQSQGNFFGISQLVIESEYKSSQAECLLYVRFWYKYQGYNDKQECCDSFCIRAVADAGLGFNCFFFFSWVVYIIYEFWKFAFSTAYTMTKNAWTHYVVFKDYLGTLRNIANRLLFSYCLRCISCLGLTYATTVNMLLIFSQR